MLNTAQKMVLARGLARGLQLAGVRQHQRVRRRGITFDLDLGEGIDLSLFIFGSFQRHVIDIIRRVVPSDGIVLDIGANIGAVTLPAAAHVRNGHVYAIEPTAFAFAKLAANIRLNPLLEPRISPVNVFIADSTSPTSDLVAYSSWPVTRHTTSRHPVHQGTAMLASCAQMTLDDFLVQAGLTSIALVKIDTDGHEFEVLTGGRRCLCELRPVVVFEACEYLMRPPRPAYEDFERLFRDRGYLVCHPASFQTLTATEFRRQCPNGGGMDLAAIPVESHHHGGS